MPLSLNLPDLLSPSTREELEQFVSQLGGYLDEEHAEDGSHGAVTLDTLATKDTAEYRLPMTGNLVFQRGGLYLDEEGSELHVAMLRPPQWAGHQNDYAPPGIRDAFGVEVETGADRNLTGISVSGLRQKRLLLFGNRGNYIVTLKHNSSSSIAVHRIASGTGSDVAVASGEYVWLYYDVGSTLWRVVGPQ